MEASTLNFSDLISRLKFINFTKNKIAIRKLLSKLDTNRPSVLHVLTELSKNTTDLESYFKSKKYNFYVFENKLVDIPNLIKNYPTYYIDHEHYYTKSKNLKLDFSFIVCNSKEDILIVLFDKKFDITQNMKSKDINCTVCSTEPELDSSIFSDINTRDYAKANK